MTSNTQIVSEIGCRLGGHTAMLIQDMNPNTAFDEMRCDDCGETMYRGELDGRIAPGFYVQYRSGLLFKYISPRGMSL